jgi:hypothetical protein
MPPPTPTPTTVPAKRDNGRYRYVHNPFHVEEITLADRAFHALPSYGLVDRGGSRTRRIPEGIDPTPAHYLNISSIVPSSHELGLQT